MKIGLFGGSFDPVHNDHIAICQQFKNFLGLDKVVVMPTKLSPFKSSHATEGFHRKKMLELAFEDCPFVTVSDYELNNDSVSYTYLTVQKLKEDYQLKFPFLLAEAFEYIAKDIRDGKLIIKTEFE